MILEPAKFQRLFDERAMTMLAVIVSLCTGLLVVGANLTAAAEHPQKAFGQTGKQAGEGANRSEPSAVSNQARDGLEPSMRIRRVPDTRRPTELPSTVSDRVRSLLDANAPARRFRALNSLGTNLSGDELGVVYAVLLSKPSDKTKRASQDRVFKNELMNKLRHQESPPAGLTDVLIQIHLDKDQDEVLRDYALQHLAAWHERADSSGKNRIRQTLWSALAETQSSIAGTALLALSRLAGEDPELKPDRIAEAALRLAGSEECGELARITALQVCSRMGKREILPVAMRLAETASSIPLRVSAIAAVADLGGQQAKPFLERLAAESNQPMKQAARLALARLSNQSEP
jgi:hypothetical protein